MYSKIYAPLTCNTQFYSNDTIKMHCKLGTVYIKKSIHLCAIVAVFVDSALIPGLCIRDPRV